MDPAIVLRTIVSLAAVLALLWFLNRRFGKKTAGRRANVPVTIVGRAALGRRAHAVIIDADGKRLVLGVTDHGVSVLNVDDAPAQPDFADVIDRQDTTRADRAAAASVPLAAPFRFDGLRTNPLDDLVDRAMALIGRRR